MGISRYGIGPNQLIYLYNPKTDSYRFINYLHRTEHEHSPVLRPEIAQEILDYLKNNKPTTDKDQLYNLEKIGDELIYEKVQKPVVIVSTCMAIGLIVVKLI